MTPDPVDTVEQFELAWQQGTPPRLELFLPSEPSSRKDALLELLPIDLEYRWRRAAATGGSSWVLEDYVRHYPELGPLDQLSPDLIAEEYRVRHRWGDAPAADVYLRRFPAQVADLAELMRRMDARLSAEQARQHLLQGRAIPLAMPIADGTFVAGSLTNVEVNALQAARTDRLPENGFAFSANPAPHARPVGLTVGGLVETLRQCGLLGSAQLDELVRGSLERFPDVHALAHDLLCRDWLTSYQVTQLLQGHANELTLGPYRLLERLGSGGSGQVFKARHQKMNRLVALKVLHNELLADGECVARFLREIQIVSQLDHPNLVPAYDAGPVGHSYFLAMKYIEGTDLGRLVKKGGPLLLTQACEYVRQAALGLEHLHRHGLVHRDIKPHNLMIGRNGVVKVADLGLARGPHGEATELTSAGSTGSLTPPGGGPMGTTDYLAPEQAIDFHAADIRADIYSLGCTFWYLLTGKPPFPARSLAEALLSHQTRELPAIEQLRPDVPAGVANVLRRMLAKPPEDRYQAPAEVAEALTPYSSAPNALDLEVDFVPRSSSSWSFRAGAYSTWQMLGKFAKRNKAFTASVVTVLIFLTWSSIVNYKARQRTEQAYQRYQKERAEKERRTRKAVPAFVTGARLAVDRRQFDKGLTLANMALEYDPQCAEAQLLKGQLLIVTRKEFVQAATELDKYLAFQPRDAATRKLAALCRANKPDDAGNLLQMALVFEQQNSQALADGLLSRYAPGSPEARKKLLELYRQRIEAAWPKLGSRLEMDDAGIYRLSLGGCIQVTQLAVLQDMPLTGLDLGGCPVRDLSPLKGMPLTRLSLGDGPQVNDLSPLKGMPLTDLDLLGTQPKDLSALEGMKLVTIRLPREAAGMKNLRQMKTLASINFIPATEFWTKFDRGEFPQYKP